MPLLVKDYSWRQTDDMVIIRVPLKGVSLKNVDIFTLDNYLKASYPPFLFEIFLLAPVDDKQSKCTIIDGEIIFELKKIENITWKCLESDITKAEKRNLRETIIDKSHEISKLNAELKSNKKQELQQLAVRQQISLDSKERALIEKIRDTERCLAMKDFEEWKLSNEKSGQIKGDNREIKETVRSKVFKTDRKKEIFDQKPLPSLRKYGRIEVSFTPREFPTPRRESQEQQEQEWLKKQYEARRKVGFVAEDLTPEEKDPDWLKEKGDSFFQMGNYLGAVSAYSHAIKLGFKVPAIYSNRAAAHMALGNVHKTIEDCTEALDLLTPHVANNADARASCHARRGAALCRLGILPQGLSDLEMALQLQPHNETLKKDIQKVRESLKQQQQDSSSEDD